MLRRDFLGGTAAVLLPWTFIKAEEKLTPLVEKFKLASEYIKYTEDDFKQCHLILWTDRGKIVSPNIDNVTITKNDTGFEAIVRVSFKAPYNFDLDEIQFADKQGRRIFESKHYPVTVKTGYILTVNYRLIFGNLEG